MKIVLALDGSDFSKAAVEQLNRITLPLSTEICIINVYEFPTAIGPELMATGSSLNNYYEEFISGAQKLGEKIVSEASDNLKNLNKTLTITTSVVSGLPKKVILQLGFLRLEYGWDCRDSNIVPHTGGKMEEYYQSIWNTVW